MHRCGSYRPAASRGRRTSLQAEGRTDEMGGAGAGWPTRLTRLGVAAALGYSCCRGVAHRGGGRTHAAGVAAGEGERWGCVMSNRRNAGAAGGGAIYGLGSSGPWCTSDSMPTRSWSTCWRCSRACSGRRSWCTRSSRRSAAAGEDRVLHRTATGGLLDGRRGVAPVSSQLRARSLPAATGHRQPDQRKRALAGLTTSLGALRAGSTVWPRNRTCV